MNPDHQFPNTRWSIILQAQGSDSEIRERALEQICRTYWLPVYAFARGQGLAPADAEDLTQDVLAGLLDKRAFEEVAADKGKLGAGFRLSPYHYTAEEFQKARSASAAER